MQQNKSVYRPKSQISKKTSLMEVQMKENLVEVIYNRLLNNAKEKLLEKKVQ